MSAENEVQRFQLVDSWGIEQGVGMVINGQALPYAVSFEGPMVEAVDDVHHLLWVPLIANGPAPRSGRPEGELALATEGDA